MIDVSVITVTHESKEFIADQVLSVVLSALTVRYEQIIVDNASKDGTADLIERGYLSYVHLIRNEKNIGFAAANNQALAFARGRYILFLNPDMRLEMGSLDTLVPWMDAHPEVGISGCKLLDREGCSNPALYPRKFPPMLVNMAYFLCLHNFFPSLMQQFQYDDFDPDKEQKVDSVRGAFMLVRRGIIEQLGRAFDPRYFLLFEDLDLCREVRDLGLHIVYTPSTSCIDLFHRSFLHHSRIWKYCQMSKSLFIYTQKWGSKWQTIAVGFSLILGFFLRLPFWLLCWKDSFCKRA